MNDYGTCQILAEKHINVARPRFHSSIDQKHTKEKMRALRLKFRWFFPESKSDVVFALSFPHYLGISLQNRSMNVASLEFLSEQPPFFGLALMHGFHVFAVPAANKLLATHSFLNLTSTEDSIYGLGCNDNGQRRESKVKLTRAHWT